MRSSSSHHYPHITFKGDEKFLWNPVSKKTFKNLPEERVRLSFVDYLIEEATFSKNRIAFESAIELPKDKSKSRTDLICYNKDFKPILLAECKAPEVRLDAKVALQIARYNQKVSAPFLLVTNGIVDYWFAVNDSNLKFIDEIPAPFYSSAKTERTLDYWSNRGFAGKKSRSEIIQWIIETCDELYTSNESEIRYFDFEGAAPELGLANYYRIFSIEEDSRLALSLTSTPFGATKLNAVMNHNGQNVALLSVSLDLLITEEERNTILQTSDGIDHFDLKDKIGFNLNQSLSFYIKALSDLML